MSKELRIGVIGAAGRGSIAHYAHTPATGSRLVAAADPYPEGQRRFKEKFSDKFPGEEIPPLYEDYREMIEKENLDGVIIASPDFLHEEQAVFALEHKLAVYLEKPMALTIAGCDRILETAYRNRAKLVVGHNMRYMRFTRKMKEIIDSGVIGEVKSIWCRHFISYGGDAYFRDWHADSSKSNSMLLQKGAHDIDIIHWLAGGVTSRVSGIGNLSVYDKLPRRPMTEKRLKEGNGLADIWSADNWPAEQQKDFYPIIDINDLNMINMTLNNGVLCCYLQCHYTPDQCRNYTVIGTKGRIENYGHETIQVWTTRQDAPWRLEGDITYRTPAPKTNHGGADPLIVGSFIDALRGKYDVWSTAQMARHSVACGCQGADSIRQNGIPLDVPPLPDYLENWDFTKAEEKK
ncbi:MAG: Gfo/Idh/MocA family oxidoreductase [Lentisphaeria bacterium]|nr:Gfo/Idh/MocA family oxidoreductase [Lentisphaeria bacterium]